MAIPNNSTSHTLDPQNWDEMRTLGHQMMDDMIDYLMGLSERPSWQPMPDEVKNSFQEELPRAGKAADEVYAEFKKNVLPYPVGNIHPRYWGWVQGSGSVMGAFSEFLAASMNSMSWGGQSAGVYLENQVLDWMKTLMGFPQKSSGILVSGTSVATIIALAVARKRFAPQEMSELGLNQSVKPLRIYCSSETHNCLVRAAEILGIGRSNVVEVPVNEGRQIDLGKLEEAIARDSGNGAQPMCIVGSAGTVGTGSIDDLHGMAALSAKYGLWFHVDGAIGAVAKCSKRLSPLLKGMERADSIAFDLHKWLHIPYEAGCILIRDSLLHKKTFANPAHYLTLLESGITASGDTYFNDYGIELSRGMKALKIWMALKEQGIEKHGELMDQNVAQACYLAAEINKDPHLELMATGPLNTVCFRYTAAGASFEQTNDLNKRLLIAIQEKGIAVPSPFICDGKFGLRVCITNHRTRTEDLDSFLSELSILGRQYLPSVHAST